MDRKNKRSRSTTPTSGKGAVLMGGGTGGESPPKKKSKLSSSTSNNTSNTKKPKKRNRSNSENLHSSSTRKKGSSGMSTATADGEMMAQMLSTFSKLEASRFEAFQRSSFDANAVQEWLAACLSDRHGLLLQQNQQQQHQQAPVIIRPLEDLVAAAPGQADDIGMVVATLAKTYAQRLVSTAHKLRLESAIRNNRHHNNNNNNEASSNTDDTSSTIHEMPLTPQDILRAYERRNREGLDPGFFLQPQSALHAGVLSNAKNAKDYDARRLAALAAQEAYDKLIMQQQVIIAEEEEQESEEVREADDESKEIVVEGKDDTEKEESESMEVDG